MTNRSSVSESLFKLFNEEFGEFGGFMLRKQCHNLGIVPDRVKESDLPALSQILSQAVSGFVTQEKARSINKVILSLADMPETIASEPVPENRTRMNLNIGESYINTGDWDFAEKHFRKMLKEGEEQKDKKKQCSSLERIAFIAEERGLFDDAMNMYEECLRIADSAGNSLWKAGAYAGIGNLQWKLGNYSTASVVLQKAEELARSGDKGLRGKILLNMGNLAGDQGDADRARELYTQALSFLEASKDFDKLLYMARTYNNLGDTFLRSEDYDNALEYFKKSEACAREYGNDDMTAWTLFNMAEVYAKLGDVKEGYNCLEESREILARLKDQLGLANTHHCTGLLLSAEGKVEDALASFNRALAEFRRLSTPLEQGITLTDIGLLHLQKGNWDEAEKRLLDAKRIFSIHQIRDQRRKVENILKEANISPEDT